MPFRPDPKVRLLFSAPLAAMAAALVRAADGTDQSMASAVPRALLATFACAAVAVFASSADAGRRGPLQFVSGLAMAAASAMSLAFGAGLCVAACLAGGPDLLAFIVCAFVLLLMTAAALILSYVVATITDLRARTAAAALACQVALLAALILVAHQGAACAVAATASAVALHAALRLRAARKK